MKLWIMMLLVCYQVHLSLILQTKCSIEKDQCSLKNWLHELQWPTCTLKFKIFFMFTFNITSLNSNRYVVVRGNPTICQNLNCQYTVFAFIIWQFLGYDIWWDDIWYFEKYFIDKDIFWQLVFWYWVNHILVFAFGNVLLYTYFLPPLLALLLLVFYWFLRV